MRQWKQLRALGSVVLLGASIAALPNCSSDPIGGDTPGGCGSLDVKVQAQATVRAFAEAAVALETAATRVEAQFKDACNAIIRDLNDPTVKEGATAQEACANLNARVKVAANAGAKVELVVSPGGCSIDANVSAQCQASCSASGSCDVQAACEPGKLSVECSGSCSGSCTGGSVECSAQCEGSCTGTCEAPRWEGVCEAGCTASFTGKCGGVCEGKCDGQAANGSAAGNCAGTCEGTCSAQADGSCQARCTGQFRGGCEAKCTGSCSGSCSVSPPSCTGRCQGTCTGEAKAPKCEGKVSCDVNAECKGSCDAKAEATVTCTEPEVTVAITGDAALFKAVRAHAGKFGAAFNATLALKDDIGVLAGKGAATFQALGDIGLSGAACVAGSVTAAARASASINVSVQASASFNASAG